MKSEKLVRLILVLVGIIVVLIGGYLLYYGLTQWFDFQRGTRLMYGFLILLLLFYVFLALPRGKKLQLSTKTVSVVRCDQCEAVIVREFLRGDYVFKEEGECTKCGLGRCYIEEIFEAPLKKEKTKKE